jgi:sugar lactone lactonase YvrE
MAFEEVIGGINFGEGPRWHNNRLWYSDFYQGRIYAVSEDGDREAMVEFGDDQPSGLGWMPNGDLLVVSMIRRQIWRVDTDGNQSLHADLSEIAEFHCNDMVVDHAGNAYVGNFGFDFEGGDNPRGATLALVRADGTASSAASDLMFANGSVITRDDSTLIVGQTFGGLFEAWNIEPDATLSNRRVWAEVPGTAPDGCCLDSLGAIWFADAIGKQLVRVTEGGTITNTLPTDQPVFACMLGGSDGRTLFALTAADSHPDTAAATATGALISKRVDVPHAGLP